MLFKFFKKNWPWFLILITINSVSILALILNNWFVIGRPVFIYEYNLLILLLAFRIRTVFLWIAFLILFFIDVTGTISSLYLFSLPEFIKNIKFLFNYQFHILQIVLFIFLLLYMILVYVILRWVNKTIMLPKGQLIKTFVIVFFFLISIDILNGSTQLSNYKWISFTKNNFSGSLLKVQLIAFKHYFGAAKYPVKRTEENKSACFQLFAVDSNSNQLLIIVESWGMIKDSLKRNNFEKDISADFKQTGWKSAWGKSAFNGSTTNAELRELLNATGNYTYFLTHKSNDSFPSIFDLKHQQGYANWAAHSFKGSMFERNIWWNNIGIDNAYFLEEIIKTKQSKLNYDTPFPSVEDETAFLFLQESINTDQKHFGYFLSENSHLSFNGEIEDIQPAAAFSINREPLSEEGRNQLTRIRNFLYFLSIKLDHKKWDKILIVGDHMPPFATARERNYYTNSFVPIITLTK